MYCRTGVSLVDLESAQRGGRDKRLSRPRRCLKASKLSQVYLFRQNVDRTDSSNVGKRCIHTNVGKRRRDDWWNIL